jgi:hypothetical protein
MILHGTLIATVITKNLIYLFSDGRLINKERGVINDNWSKIHKINDLVGMLVAGQYIQHLRDDIIRNCQRRNLKSVKDVAEITSLVLKGTWNNIAANPEYKEKISEIKIFAFIVGFDASASPHLYFVDSMSSPMFRLQERLLFLGGEDLEIGAISYESGIKENPSNMLINQIIPHRNLINRKEFELKDILLRAFNDIKNELSKNHSSIGGQTFFAVIDNKKGFKNILTKH